MDGYIILETGQVLQGISIGADTERACELVFNTAMAGHTELITNPVYDGKALCFSYPMIGNCGICPEDFQSDKPVVAALVVSDCSEVSSNFRAKDSLQAVLKRYGIPAISGIDTRFPVRLLRERGSLRVFITTDAKRAENPEATLRELAEYQPKDRPYLSPRAGKSYGSENGKTIALLDIGAENSLIQSLTDQGLRVRVYAADTPAESILADKPDGLLLPGGPGNPNSFTDLIQTAKAFYDTPLPLMAIGLGHQLLALAVGCKVISLPCGHNGLNHPVQCLDSGKVLITEQLHRFTVDEGSLPPDICRVSHRNVNDGSVEGLRYNRPHTLSLQFRPTAYGFATDFRF